jgi:hypothetical protein
MGLIFMLETLAQAGARPKNMGITSRKHLDVLLLVAISKSLINQLGIHLFLAKQKKLYSKQFGIQLGKF